MNQYVHRWYRSVKLPKMTTRPGPRPLRLFCCFAAEDEPLLTTLKEHITILERNYIEGWHQGKVLAGDTLTDELRNALNIADLILLLISPSFLASEYLFVEMKRAIERHSLQEARVIPIILRASAILPIELTNLQPLPSNGRPVMSWPNRDEAWENVFVGISAVIRERIRYIGPEPTYPDRAIHSLSDMLLELYNRRETLYVDGLDTTAVDSEILAVRRQIRQGPQLHEGEFLGDGRYRLIRIIGNGGFASVWHAYDRYECRPVAIKVLHGQWTKDLSRIERFERGARRMAQLNHPGIVRVITRKEEEVGFHYFTMELLEGGDLRAAILRANLAGEKIREMIIGVGLALEYAHQMGVIHRDVKPANILLDRYGQAKLTDFDLVWAPDTTGGSTSHTFGTVIFAAPEAMADALNVDVRSDIFSLGMTALFAFYGNDLPIDALRNPIPILERLSCPEQVREAIRKAISWEKEDRFLRAVDFCHALAKADMQEQKSIYTVKSNWRLPAVIGGGALTVIAGSVLLPVVSRWQSTPDLGWQLGDNGVAVANFPSSVDQLLEYQDRDAGSADATPEAPARPGTADNNNRRREVIHGTPTTSPRRPRRNSSAQAEPEATALSPIIIDAGQSEKGLSELAAVDAGVHGDIRQEVASSSTTSAMVNPSQDSGTKLVSPDKDLPYTPQPLGNRSRPGGALKPTPGARCVEAEFVSIRDWADISRSLSNTARPSNVAWPGKGVLFSAPHPVYPSALKICEELHAVTNAALTHDNKLAATVCRSFRPSIHAVMNDICTRRPWLFHLSGHGGRMGPLLPGHHGAHEAPNRQSWYYLGSLMRASGIRCVVLNSCFSADTAFLLAETVGCALGVDGILQECAAIALTESFYVALFSGCTVKTAFETSCERATRHQEKLQLVLAGNAEMTLVFPDTTSET